MRVVVAVVMLVACGGSPKPAPAASAPPPATAAAPEPTPAPVAHDDVPPPEPEAKEQVAMGDPCEGGEVNGLVASGEGAGGGGIGTIGHGSGVGAGTGGLRGRTASVPSITLGDPTVKGDLDKAIVRRFVKRNLNKLRYCYEKQLLAKPNVHGKLVVKFAITDQGQTADVTAPTSFDGEVAACAITVFQGIEFPKPKSSRVAVSYPFTFAAAAP